MFESLRGLFNKYWEMKLAARGGRTSFPSTSKFETPEAVYDPRKAMDIVEEAKAFIGDVDLYLKGLEWWEELIMLSHFAPPGYREVEDITPEKIRKILRRKVNQMIVERRQVGQVPPALLKWRQSIEQKIRTLNKAAEAHFRAAGYISEGWEPPTERRFGD